MTSPETPEEMLALREIAAFNITPSTGASVAMREAVKRAVCCPQGCQYEGDSEDGQKCYCDTSDYHGSGVEKQANAVFAALSTAGEPKHSGTSSIPSFPYVGTGGDRKP